MNRILFFWFGLLLVVMTGMWVLIGLPSSAPAEILLPASGQTYYVRTDGGSAARCTGRVDAPDPGSGTNRPCAWDHPFRALPPGSTPRITGGDTLIIASGSYKMGYGALGAEACDYEASYDCLMPHIPSGPDASHPTRILGGGWNAGCANPPELWGTGRPWFIVNLTDSSNVQIACMEITDHSSCIEDHLFPIGGSPYTCQRDTPPYGDWAATGLYAEDSTNVHLEDLNIHGLANTGIQAGRLTDWTVENVRLAGNGLAGWNSDLVGDGSNSENHGTFIFRHWTVEWNGCGETYPDEQYIGCWGQEAGGYGDGAGFGGTTGGHYIIEDSAFLHNTSDGLDMLYVRLPGALIEIRRTISEGNDGNQIKTSGDVTIENSIIVSNCGFFHGMPYWNNDDDCRAVGDSLVFDLNPGGQATVTNSTITGEGNCLLIAGCALDKTCNGSEQVLMRNVIFQGQKVFWSPGDDTCFAWYDNESSPPMPADPFVVEYSLITGVRFGNVDPCPGLHNLCDVTSGLENTAIDAFDAHLLAGSLAINAGTTNGAPADDFDGNARDTHPDIGAYEYNASPPPSGAYIYLPLVLRAGGAVSTPTPTPTNTSIRTATISIAPSTNTPTKTSTSTPTHTSTPGVTSTPGADNPNPPTNPVKLIFIHHSSGENWLADDNGGLGIALMNNNYFVSDTNYGWTVDGDIIGDRTDIGNWWEWFRGPNSATYLNALYTEYGQNSGYSRLATDPGGENKIVMFKSCFPNSALQGDPAAAPPPITSNPLRGQDAYSKYHTVANAKGIYIDLLEYFRAHRDKLFVVITAPPLQDGTWANNARAFNNWLVNDWLDGYPYKNVAVFDFYNVLTSNGGDPDTSDIGWVNGNHHRWWNSAVQHQQTVAGDTAAYPSSSDDDHANYIGNEKATSEFVQLLNVFYHRWAAESP